MKKEVTEIEDEQILSDKSVKQVLFELESIPETFDFRVRGISLYFIFRFILEQVYRNKHTFIDRTFVSTVVLNGKRQLKKFFSKATSFNAKSPLAQTPSKYLNSQILFVSTSDWIIDEGESIELVDIIRHYKTLGLTINFVQPDYQNNTIRKQQYHDCFYTLQTNNRVKLSRKEKTVLNDFLDFISNQWRFDLKKDFDSYFSHVCYCLSMADQLNEIITSTQAKYIFARSLYTEPWIPIACERTNIKCIEVQHGVVTPDNVYYQSYLKPEEMRNKILFPDYILTLGEEWSNILIRQKSKFSAANTFTLGVNEYEQQRPTEKSDALKVLFCLQHGRFTIDKILISFLKTYYQQIDSLNIDIYIRPHPNSYISTVLLYKSYCNNKVQIVDSKAIQFKDDIINAKLLVSASSMCIYEALAMGIPAVSFTKFKGITIPEAIYYADSQDDLFNFINRIREGNFEQKKIHYLSPFNSSVLNTFLN